MKHYVVINHYILSPEIEQLAINAIKSFKKSDCIIVSVDDASPIQSDSIKELSDVFIQREENGGFATSANTGIQWVLDNAKDCFITYANNDLEVSDWQEETERCFNDTMQMPLRG